MSLRNFRDDVAAQRFRIPDSEWSQRCLARMYEHWNPGDTERAADSDGLGERDVEAHLSDLAVDGNVAPTTQNTAFHALVKFFKVVLQQDMGRIEAIRASKGKMVPTVLGADEVARIFDAFGGRAFSDRDIRIL